MEMDSVKNMMEDEVLRSIFDDLLEVSRKRQQEYNKKNKLPDKLTYQELFQLLLDYNPEDPFPLPALPLPETVSDK